MQRQTKRLSAATIRALGEILTGGDFYGGELVRAVAWPLVFTGPGPAPAVGAQSPVRVLPNFDVVALDGLAPAEALLLDAFATRSADHVWTLSTASLPKALHAGRGLEDLRRFLTGSSPGEELPQTAMPLPADAASRTEKVRDLGTCHLLECVDGAQAVMFEKDRRAGALCSRIGPRHLMWWLPTISRSSAPRC
ncbi:hypothetical protein DIZ27_41475 [Streptomyces sp. NWU339]|uniref:hypothetical protein n=1 Tax=Streptomyces sp. NWU339 TaxID=2185284 RepID=UPI000D678666|nr:hypothetical protein [Streptomyces sp. NWU339]PWI05061.1 hypothetical protein DIZ27_41475 [Streptomyces sp. NWU339]